MIPRPIKPTYRMQGLAEDGITPLKPDRFWIVRLAIVVLVIACLASIALVVR